MHFYVDGPKNHGIARLHMVKYRGHSDFEYKYLFVDIKGHDRIYLEQEDTTSSKGGKKLSFFGVKW
ncbi:mitochondrial import inner membrane translocase subunit tim21 [Fusarium musae]|nr:mitochondrial import inner membrane translocase subunit tim21 [Fusarium musae]KAG9504493.1 mitochondrial import inner membrane translocase subunit tim21 [Fusarium musae]